MLDGSGCKVWQLGKWTPPVSHAPKIFSYEKHKIVSGGIIQRFFVRGHAFYGAEIFKFQLVWRAALANASPKAQGRLTSGLQCRAR
jgi:hypothetical protein